MVDTSQQSTNMGAREPILQENLPTQRTVESPQRRIQRHPEIWGSLIPLNSNNACIHRIDFMKGKNSYAVGRGGDSSYADFLFPNMSSMSESFLDAFFCTLAFKLRESGIELRFFSHQVVAPHVGFEH